MGARATMARNTAGERGARQSGTEGLAVLRELIFGRARLNVNGGAVARGHPLRASGARILTTLLYAMKHRGSSAAWQPCASAWVRAL